MQKKNYTAEYFENANKALSMPEQKTLPEPAYYKTEIRKGKKVLHTMLVPAEEAEMLLTEQDGLFRTPLYTQDQLSQAVQKERARAYKAVLMIEDLLTVQDNNPRACGNWIKIKDVLKAIDPSAPDDLELARKYYSKLQPKGTDG